MSCGKYLHDCDLCEFLFEFCVAGQNVDVYRCTQNEDSWTVVLRYGDEGYEYDSGQNLQYGKFVFSIDSRGEVTIKIVRARS